MQCRNIAIGVKLIAEALLTNNTLKIIDLSGNKITDEGAKLFAVALEKNKTLIHVNLSANRIGDVGVESIADALKINSRLNELKLHLNQIASIGIKSISTALLNNRTITDISLSSNLYDEEGVKSIIYMHKNNYKILFNEFDGHTKFILESMQYSERNLLLKWCRVQFIIIDICIAIWKLQLPNYIILEIIDWFPHWEVGINRYKKITLIENVKKSILKILENRKKL